MSTGYGFTGQYSDSYINLLDYGSRRYDQADTIVPAGVQGLDRYAYTFNNPIKYIDPSGHDPWIFDPDFHYAESSLYVDAGIYQQSRCQCDSKSVQTGLTAAILGPEVASAIYEEPYTSEGPAKISDAQMNNPYGYDICPTKNCGEENHGLGLGLIGGNQHDYGIARIGMSRRIGYGLSHVCSASCSATDKMMVAALAANGDLNASNYLAIKKALQKSYHNSPDEQFDWANFLEYPNYFSDNQRNHFLNGGFPSIDGFVEGFDSDYREAHPEVDWDYLDGLIQ